MASEARPIDKLFLISVSTLAILGFIIFLSASLGLLAQSGTSLGNIALKQGISLAIGALSFYILSKLKYTWLRRGAFFIFLGAIIINLLLFVPGLAMQHGGASRWIDLGFFTFQPSELLKIAFIIYLSAWIYFAKDKIEKIRYGILPYMILMTILTLLLLAQTDTDTLVIIGVTGLTMLFISGVPYKHIAIMMVMIGILVAGVIYFRPYAYARFKTYLDRSHDTSGASYQINQSLIAVGSGQLSGRGFGQSIQKFGYLPQPTDDSIFAVAAEEFGFIGSTILIALYMIFAISCFRISSMAPDPFGAMTAAGIAVLIIGESFLNIGAMIGLVPLSGLPLLFISHGGTALIIVLAASGIVANISKYRKS